MAIPDEIRKRAQALVDEGNYTAAKKLVKQHNGDWPRDLTGDKPSRKFQAHSSMR